jgi:hypothetical protein
MRAGQVWSNIRAAPMPANMADDAAKKLWVMIAFSLIRSSVRKTLYQGQAQQIPDVYTRSLHLPSATKAVDPKQD